MYQKESENSQFREKLGNNLKASSNSTLTKSKEVVYAANTD
jgi:hypothetical protein